MVVSLGLLGGAMIGAVCGFVAGLLLDSALLQTLGVSSLVLLGAGYLAGRYRESAEVSNSLIPPLLAGVLTTAAAAGFAAIQLMLGVNTTVSLLVLREVFVQGLLAVILTIPIYPLIRRAMRPALVDDFAALGAELAWFESNQPDVDDLALDLAAYSEARRRRENEAVR